MEEYDIFIPHIPGTFARPYAARILGEDPVYRLKRRFLRYTDCDAAPDGQWFFFPLPTDGVYEFCVRRFQRETRRLVSREREWIILFDGSLYEIGLEDVLYALFNLRAQSAPVRTIV